MDDAPGRASGPDRCGGRGDGERAAWQLPEHYARAAARLCLCLDPDHDPAKLRAAVIGMVPGCDAALEAIQSP